MIQQHPLYFIDQKHRQRLFFIFLFLTITGFGIFQLLDQPLRNPEAPSGIVSFELAGTPEKAQAMLASWDDQSNLNNAFGLGFDFLFMPVYTIALSLGILLASSRLGGFWPRLGALIGWAALLAPIFDSIENIALFTILSGNPVSPYPQIAAWCATIKFTLLLAGLLYGLIGWLGGRQR